MRRAMQDIEFWGLVLLIGFGTASALAGLLG